MQIKENRIAPIAYHSRSLTVTERQYAQIEKECLAITWACEKFRTYLIGRCFKIETDHKPLLSILNRKQLDELSPRLQRMKMRLMRFNFTVNYKPGPQMYTADTLSRDPVDHSEDADEVLEEEISFFVSEVIQTLPCSSIKLQELENAQRQDGVLNKVAQMCTEGWPTHQPQDNELKKFWTEKENITVANGLLLKQNRVIIPENRREEMLLRIHDGHLGIVKCRERAKRSVWWPGIGKAIEDTVKKLPNL